MFSFRIITELTDWSWNKTWVNTRVKSWSGGLNSHRFPASYFVFSNNRCPSVSSVFLQIQQYSLCADGLVLLSNSPHKSVCVSCCTELTGGHRFFHSRKGTRWIHKMHLRMFRKHAVTLRYACPLSLISRVGCVQSWNEAVATGYFIRKIFILYYFLSLNTV